VVSSAGGPGRAGHHRRRVHRERVSHRLRHRGHRKLSVGTALHIGVHRSSPSVPPRPGRPVIRRWDVP